MTEPRRPGPPEGFDAAYASGVAPWDVGAPQPAIAAVADKVSGKVLDAGCGTGEHALFFAARGCEAWGIDGAPLAIEKAKHKARARGLQARFEVHDAFQLEGLGETFDAVIDSGLFHIFADDERERYVKSLGRVVRPGGLLVLMCFNENTPGEMGPRRVTQAELRASFSGWKLEDVSPVEFVVTDPQRRPQAWRALFRR